MTTPTVLREATINFDANGKATSITIDGKNFTGFPAGTYDMSSKEGGGSIQVRIEIPVGDYRGATSVPAYTIFHHRGGNRISVSGHS